eukprot:g1105.t1
MHARHLLLLLLAVGVRGNAGCTDGTITGGSGIPGADGTTCECDAGYVGGGAVSGGSYANCAACGTGKYQPQAGQTTACKDCGAGEYTDQAGQTSCTGCTTGQYQDQEAQTACKECAEGKFRTNALASTVETDACQACASGQYQNQKAQTACLKCAAGKYRDTIVGAESGETTACKDCGAGEYTDETGLTECKGDPCEAGKFFAQKAQTAPVTCNECGAGQHQNQQGQTNCKGSLCAIGKFFAQTAMTTSVTCNDCGAGEYTDETGLTECKGDPCEAGKFFAQKAQTAPVTCNECALGQFTDQAGQTSCAACAFGRHQTLAEGNTDCEGDACTPGTFFETVPKQSTAVQCKGCAGGRYQDERGKRTCKDCPKGKFQTAQASQQCQQTCDLGCAPGSREALPQSPAQELLCGPCNIGRYSGHDECNHVTNPHLNLGWALAEGTSRAIEKTGAVNAAPMYGGHTFMTQLTGSNGFLYTYADLTFIKQIEVKRTYAASVYVRVTNVPAGKDPPRLALTAWRALGRNTNFGFGWGKPSADGTGVLEPEDARAESFAWKWDSTCVAIERRVTNVDAGTVAIKTKRNDCGAMGRAVLQNVTVPAQESRRNFILSCRHRAGSGIIRARWLTSATAWQDASTVLTNPGESAISNVSFETPPGVTTIEFGITVEEEAGALPVQITSLTLIEVPSSPSAPMFDPAHSSFGCNGTYSTVSPDWARHDGCVLTVSNATNITREQPSVPYVLGVHFAGLNPNAQLLLTAGEIDDDDAVKTFTQECPSKRCASCPSGKYADATGATVCLPCQPGRYAVPRSQGIDKCTACPEGKYQDSAEQVSCEICPAGKFGDALGATACNECAIGKFQDGEKNISCKSCPAGQLQNSTDEELQCGAGVLKLNDGFWNSELNVEGLLVGATAKNPVNPYTTFTKCPLKEACVVDDYHGNVTCRQGHAGTLCAVCKKTFTRNLDGGCAPCPQTSITEFLKTQIVQMCTIGALVMLLAAMAAMDARAEWKICRAVQQRLQGLRYKFMAMSKIIFNFGQIVTLFGIVCEIDLPEDVVVVMRSLAFFNIDLFRWLPVDCWMTIDFHHNLYATTCTLLLVVIVIAFCWFSMDVHEQDMQSRQKQRVADSSSAELTLPDSAPRNAHSTSSTSLGSRVANMLANPTTPAKLAGKAISSFGLKNYILRVITAILAVVYLVYPRLSATIFQTFNCGVVRHGGRDNSSTTSYLVADYSIDCASAEHKNAEKWAWAMVAVISVGTPIFYYVLARQNHVAISRGDPSSKYLAFLCRDYTVGCWYWETVEILRKLLLTGFIVFLKKGTLLQVVVSMLIEIAYLASLVHKRPFIRNGDQKFALMTSLNLLVYMFTALLLEVDALLTQMSHLREGDFSPLAHQGYGRQFLSGVLISLLGIVICGWIVMFRMTYKFAQIESVMRVCTRHISDHARNWRTSGDEVATGTIMRVNGDKTYDVLFDSGDRERAALEVDIKSATRNPPYRKGDKVEAKGCIRPCSHGVVMHGADNAQLDGGKIWFPELDELPAEIDGVPLQHYHIRIIHGMCEGEGLGYWPLLELYQLYP